MDQNLEQYRQLYYLNAPLRLNGVTINEIIIFFTTLGVFGFFVGKIVGILMAVGCFLGIRQLKRRIPDLSPYMYWNFPDFGMLERIPLKIKRSLPLSLRSDSIPSHVRKYQG